MLCLSRQTHEGIRIGGKGDLSRLLAPDELLALEQCRDGAVSRAVTKLVAALEAPSEVYVLSWTEARGAKLGTEAPRWRSVDRIEVADAKAAAAKVKG